MTRVTAGEAAELLGVPAEAVKNWKARRKVMPVAMLRGRGHGGRIPVYELEDLRPLAERYLERVKGRRDTPGSDGLADPSTSGVAT